LSFILTGVLEAQAAGFYINLQPDRRYTEAEDQAYRQFENDAQAQHIDTTLFEEDTPVEELRRTPLHADPYVVVPQFAPHVPPELFDVEFQQSLAQRFPFVRPMNGNFGEDRYVAVLDYVERFLNILHQPVM
jgi:hypothetical protein